MANIASGEPGGKSYTPAQLSTQAYATTLGRVAPRSSGGAEIIPVKLPTPPRKTTTRRTSSRGTSTKAKPLYSSSQINKYKSDLAKITAAQNKKAEAALNAVKNPAPTRFVAPFELGRFSYDCFNPNNPCYRIAAESIADQAIREGRTAQCVAQSRYLNTYNQALACMQFQQSQAEAANQAARNQSLNALQNMGANTGLGFGGMAQNALATADTGFRGELNNVLQQFAQNRGALAGNYQTDINASNACIAALEGGREAAVQKYLTETLIPLYQSIWQGNQQNALGGYNAGIDYLSMLGNQNADWNSAQNAWGGNNIQLGSAKADLARLMIDPMMKPILEAWAAKGQVSPY